MEINSVANANPHEILQSASAYSQSQKGAIIIALLGVEHAKSLVESLEDRHLESFIAAMQTLKFTRRPILLATIAEFIEGLRENNSGLTGGEKPARELAQALLSTERSKRLLGLGGEGPEVKKDDVWDGLKNEKVEKVANYLNTQRPELVGAVLTKMGAIKAGEILAELSDEMAEATAQHMASGLTYDSDIEQAITALLRIEFLDNEGVDDGSQTASFMTDVMGVLPKTQRDKLMDIIGQSNPDVSNKIRKGLLTFEDLPKRLPKTAVPLIFRDMDNKDLIAALKSGQEAEPKTVEFLLSNISQRMAEQYREQVAELATLSEKASDVAIITLMGFISRQEKSGAIAYINIEEAEN